MAKFKDLRSYAKRHDMHGGPNYRILTKLIEREVYCNVNSLMTDICRLVASANSSAALKDLSFDSEDAFKLQSVPGDSVEACEHEGWVFVKHDDEWFYYKGPGVPFTNKDLKLHRCGKRRWYEPKDSDKEVTAYQRLTAAEALEAYWMANVSQAFDTEEAAAEHCANDNSIDVDPYDVYEHYAVSPFFARALTEVGEQVLDIGNLNVWCRTTTGQSTTMDHCIQRVAFNMGILRHQEYDWSLRP